MRIHLSSNLLLLLLLESSVLPINSTQCPRPGLNPDRSICSQAHHEPWTMRPLRLPEGSIELTLLYLYPTIRFLLLWRLEFALSFKVTDAWKVTLLLCFHRLRNLLVLKFGLYLEASSQLICFFVNLCHKTLLVIQISSFCAATTLWIRDSGTHCNCKQ